MRKPIRSWINRWIMSCHTIGSIFQQLTIYHPKLSRNGVKLNNFMFDWKLWASDRLRGRLDGYTLKPKHWSCSCFEVLLKFGWLFSSPYNLEVGEGCMPEALRQNSVQPTSTAYCCLLYPDSKRIHMVFIFIAQIWLFLLKEQVDMSFRSCW